MAELQTLLKDMVEEEQVDIVEMVDLEVKVVLDLQQIPEMMVLEDHLEVVEDLGLKHIQVLNQVVHLLVEEQEYLVKELAEAGVVEQVLILD